jgi:hypothetical protein
VIGGITSSLILTLILVPVMYVLLAPEKFHAADDAPDPSGSGGTNGHAGTSGNGHGRPGATQPAHA